MSFTVDIWARKEDQVSSVTSRTYTPPEPDPGGEDADYKASSLAAARALDPQIGESVYVDHVGYYDVVSIDDLGEYRVLDGYMNVPIERDVIEAEEQVSVSGAFSAQLEPNVVLGSVQVDVPGKAPLTDWHMHGAWNTFTSNGDPHTRRIVHENGTISDYRSRMGAYLGSGTATITYRHLSEGRVLRRRSQDHFDIGGMGGVPYSVYGDSINNRDVINWSLKLAGVHPAAKEVYFPFTVVAWGYMELESGCKFRGNKGEWSIRNPGNNKVIEFAHVDYDNTNVEARLNIDLTFMKNNSKLESFEFEDFSYFGNALENLGFEDTSIYPPPSGSSWYAYLQNGGVHEGISISGGMPGGTSVHGRYMPDDFGPDNMYQIYYKGDLRVEHFLCNPWGQGGSGRYDMIPMDSESRFIVGGCINWSNHACYGADGIHNELVITEYGSDLIIFDGFTEIGVLKSENIRSNPYDGRRKRFTQLRNATGSTNIHSFHRPLKIGHVDHFDLRQMYNAFISGVGHWIEIGGGDVYIDDNLTLIEHYGNTNSGYCGTFGRPDVPFNVHRTHENGSNRLFRSTIRKDTRKLLIQNTHLISSYAQSSIGSTSIFDVSSAGTDNGIYTLLADNITWRDQIGSLLRIGNPRGAFDFIITDSEVGGGALPIKQDSGTGDTLTNYERAERVRAFIIDTVIPPINSSYGRALMIDEVGKFIGASDTSGAVSEETIDFSVPASGQDYIDIQTNLLWACREVEVESISTGTVVGWECIGQGSTVYEQPIPKSTSFRLPTVRLYFDSPVSGTVTGQIKVAVTPEIEKNLARPWFDFDNRPTITSTQTIDLDSIVSHADHEGSPGGLDITYRDASSANESVATVSLSGSNLTVTVLGSGATTVSVLAEDEAGAVTRVELPVGG